VRTKPKTRPAIKPCIHRLGPYESSLARSVCVIFHVSADFEFFFAPKEMKLKKNVEEILCNLPKVIKEFFFLY
jgi:hypothetical protein